MSHVGASTNHRAGSRLQPRPTITVPPPLALLRDHSSNGEIITASFLPFAMIALS